MPYIEQDERKQYNEEIQTLATELLNKPVGHVNYCITKLLLTLVREVGESYGTYNNLIGVLECVKLELYMMQVANYERKKRIQNGGVCG